MKNKIKYILKIIGIVSMIVTIVTIIIGTTSLLDMDVSELQARINGDYKLSEDIYMASKIKSAKMFKTIIWGGLISSGCLFLGMKYDD